MGKDAAGLEDLDLWLGDLVRSGFVSLSSRPKDLWDEQARRMIDAQCPGVARRLRQVDAMGFAGEGWQAALLDRLAQIHLLIEGFRHLDSLPVEVAEDVKAAIGFPVDLDAVRAGAAGIHVRDTWRILGQAYALEDKVTARRTSLWGRDTRRSALILDFSAAGRPFEDGFKTGTEVDATLGFCPGSAPIRALLIERHAPPGPFGTLEGGSTVLEAHAAFGAALARCPWVELLPIVLAEVSLRDDKSGWSAIDRSGAYIPLARSFDRGWHIEAISGGEPFTLTGEFDGSTLNPLGALIDGKFFPLINPAKKAVADPVRGSPGRRPTPDSALLLEATTAAVVGVDRKPPPTVPPDHPVGSVVAQVPASPAPARLLAVAAAGGLYARVGRRPRLASPLPPVPPEAEDRPECSPEAAARLRGLFAGSFDQDTNLTPRLFFEWFALCHRAGQRVPAGLLVDVLTFCREQAQSPPSIESILGKRGRWLALRNRDWSQFVRSDVPVNGGLTWEVGSKADRLALLRSLRATDPAEARRLVESSFASEPSAFRAEIVGLFAKNLTQDDEPFLEAALDDRSKEVRAAVAERLRTLPGSRLSDRMSERARTLLAWDGGRLAIETPRRSDPAMIRDGITEEPPPGLLLGKRSIGKKAWYLHQLIAWTPLSAIADHLERSPETIIDAARRSEWAEVIINAWEASAVRSGDLPWSRALAIARIAHDEVDIGGTFPELFATLSPEVRDAQIASRLAAASEPIRSSDPAIPLLMVSRGTFGAELGREILGRVRMALAHERDKGAEHFLAYLRCLDHPIRGLIEGLDRKLPFHLIDEIEQVPAPNVAPEDARMIHFSLYATFTAMLDRWKFRRDMHQEFAPR